MKQVIELPEYDLLKDRVLNWLRTLKVEGRDFDYKFSSTSGHSLFTTCFALYILDLFKETDKFTEEKKLNWAAYINSYQNPDDGLFYPDPIYHPDKERAVFQVTSFCLSALAILGSKPTYNLKIVDEWKEKGSVKKYLAERGVHKGKGGSGNKAMFQAIFLTHEYEKTNDPILLESIEEWFEFHNEHQNELGFWGATNIMRNTLYGGVQNAFHQLVIYEYWKKEYSNLDKINDIITYLQDYNGYFSPYPGGDSCKDYDAIHFILNNFHGNRQKQIYKMVLANNKNWNRDGGFCENIYKPYSLKHAFKIFNFVCSKKLSVFRYRLIYTLKELIKNKNKLNRKWVKESQKWNESTLWDTWFRCLIFSEISNFTDEKYPVKYLKHIGIGYK